jgi:macrolide transport system ATP-binding/permease protein
MSRTLDFFLHDLRFALRQLRRNPVFTITAILVLSIGLCASIAIFAFVDAALIKPLPYREPARLAGVYEHIPLCELCNLSYPDYLDWKRLNRTFSSIDIYRGSGFMLTTPSGTVEAGGTRVTAGFFRTLGVKSILGRDFTDGEDQPAAPRAVILSYTAWKNRYAENPNVLGQSVILDGQPNTIVGVLPPDFHFAPVGRAEFWTAVHATDNCDTRRGCHSYLGIGRLKDGVSLDNASADIAVVAHQLELQYPDTNRGQGSKIVSLSEAMVGNMRPILLVLLTGAGLLLTIAAVNVANLLLVRSEARRREIAIRSGLGASAGRLASQFVTEAMVLVGSSAAAGLIGARWLIQSLARLIPANMTGGMPWLQSLGLHYREWSFAGAVALLAALLFSLAPAIRLRWSDPRAGLAESGRGNSGTAWRRLGSNLVMAELAIAVVLLVGAGLLSKSLYRLLQVDLGMRPDHLATLRIAVPESSYPKNEQTIALERRILGDVTALPGVESAALSSLLPVSGGNTVWIRVEGQPFHGEHNEVGYRAVSFGYFTTLGARLLRGRYFADSEDESKPSVIVIDRALAEKYFPNQDPIGKRIQYFDVRSKPMEIVGVIDDIKEGSIDSTTWPTLYVPFNQEPSTYFSLVVRTSQSEQSALPTLDAAIRRIDRGIMTTDPSSMSDRINHSLATYLRRSSSFVVGGFALLALLLGVVGLYGLIAYSVSRRTREIGVRIALGARPAAVYRLILTEAAWLIAGGIATGLACSVAAATLIRSLLFGIQSWDIATLGFVSLILGVAALFASYFPARRAASVNPMDALRSE